MRKDNSGAIADPRVDYDELAQSAYVSGIYPLLPNDNDINAIISTLEAIPDAKYRAF